MLTSAKQMRGYDIAATDGELGKATDLLFDDVSWTLRYIVVDTGGWLADRLVLISPVSVESLDHADTSIHVNLTREQVENSPRAETDQPVSRQFEAEYYRYQGWMPYWGRAGLWGPGMTPAALTYPIPEPEDEASDDESEREERADPNLRSTDEVSRYEIHAHDGDIGHASDVLFDDESWEVRYLIIDTRNWLPGKHVAIRPRWVREFRWEEAKIYVDVSRDAIKSAPAYDGLESLDEAAQQHLAEHYGRETDAAHRSA
ncbi:MAG: PRC-barrel domain-containing protein [Chloroflexia bacterium]